MLCCDGWTLTVVSGVLAQLQNQLPQDPEESVFEVWVQAMVVKAPPKYGERFATSLERFAALVVEIVVVL